MFDKPQFSKADTYRILLRHPELVDKMDDRQRNILQNFLPTKRYDKINKQYLSRKSSNAKVHTDSV